MADFSWVDSLDAEQAANLRKVMSAAEKMGVPPRLAAAIAYQESKLRQRSGGDNPSVIKGGAGEIGIMQIKPTTAELVGFEKDQIMDTDANIDAGLAYLKLQLDRYKSPMLAAAAYNAGPDSATFKGFEPTDKAVDYVDSIKNYGGFVTGELGGQGGGDGNVQVDYDTEKAAALGALIGGSLGTTQKIGQMIFPDQKTVQSVTGAKGTPTENWSKAMGYGNRGQETYAKAHEAEMGTRKGAAIRNPATGQTFKPEFRFEKPPVIDPLPTAGQQIRSGLQSLGGAMARSPITTGVLAGAGVAGGMQEAQTRYGKDDKLGAGIAAAGAFGSGLSLIPTLPTRVVGAGLATASPAALMLLDRMRNQDPEQAQRALSNVDAMGIPTP